MNIVRVLRVLECIGPRDIIEEAMKNRSVKESYTISGARGFRIKEAIIGGVSGFEVITEEDTL